MKDNNIANINRMASNTVIAEFFGCSYINNYQFAALPKNIRNPLIKAASPFRGIADIFLKGLSYCLLKISAQSRRFGTAMTALSRYFVPLCLRGKIFSGLQPFVIAAALLVPALSFAQSHNTFVRQGNTSYDKNDYNEAEIKYRKALEAKPSSYTAVFNLGDALYKEKHYDAAAKQFEMAASIAPDKTSRAKAFHNLGNTYMSQEKWDESINAYKQALKNNPDDAETKYNLSYALAKKKEQDKKNQNQKNQDKDGKGDQKKDQGGNKDQQNKQGQQKDQQGNGDKQAQQQKAGPAMSDRDLDAVNEEEKGTQKKVMMELMKKQPKKDDNKTNKPW